VKRVFSSPGLWSAMICCVFVAVVYFTHDCDPLAFVIMGSRFTEGDPSGILGYDGQFAYYIARDPVGARPYLGANPSYRYQRIIYPMLARLLALGQPGLIPWTLVLINIVSISWGTELLGRMLESHGLSAWLALLLTFWLGQVFALRADLNEPLSYFFAIVALQWYDRRWNLPSALAIAASLLTKETGALFLPAIVIVELLQKRWKVALGYGLTAFVAYAGLQAFLQSWLGLSGLDQLGNRFEWIPFYGYAFTEPLAARVFLVLIIALPAAVLLVVAALRIAKRPLSLYAWGLVFNCLMIVFIPRRTAFDVLATFRVGTGLVIATLLYSAVHRSRRLALLLSAIWLPPSILAVLIPGFLL
jgi:hypothetical protein